MASTDSASCISLLLRRMLLAPGSGCVSLPVQRNVQLMMRHRTPSAALHTSPEEWASLRQQRVAFLYTSCILLGSLECASIFNR